MKDDVKPGPVEVGSLNIEAFANNVARLVEGGGKALAAYMKPREAGAMRGGMSDELTDVVKTLGEVAEYWLSDPQRAVELQRHLGKAYLELWGSAVKRMAGESTEPVASPDPKDRRFADPEWSSNQFFDFVKQAYLLSTGWADHLVQHAEGLDPHTRQKAEFYVKQIANAISPSNFVLTNPELFRETVGSNAENLVRGMHMLAEDIEAGGGDLRIRQSDASKFEVGRNLAVSPGKVIFQNELMQLIQYAPSTETVLKRPLLIVPPWINKFYVLDLTPEKSFIKWCVDNGLTVFVISWVNPDARQAEMGFEEYMKLGPIAALDAIEQATGEKQVNTIGYCVGGTLLAITLAYLAKKNDKRIASATLFTAQVDFTHAGDLKVFVDEEQLKAVEERMKERGYLEGKKMANAFNMLRSNDLIWPYVINNYMLGKAPTPFDLLYWNSELDAHARGKPRLLSAALLLGELADARPHDDRQRQARPRQREGADLQPRHPRGPYRASEIGVRRLEVLRRAGEVRAGRLRPYRGRGQSAGQAEVSILDRRQGRRRHAGELDRQSQGKSRLVVAGLARLDQRAGRDCRARACARRRQAESHRGRAGQLRQGQGLTPHLARHLHHQPQLRSLLLHGQLVAGDRR